MSRVLNKVLNKKRIGPIYFVAFFAIFSAAGSIAASSLTNAHKIIAEDASNNWLTYYQDYMDNRENVDARNKAEQYHLESVTYSLKSLKFDMVSGWYQLSVQSSILSLMLFILGFSIPKRRALRAINISAFVLLLIAVCYFGGATLQLL